MITRELHVLGVDPGLGPTTGVALLETVGDGLRVMAFQCNGDSAYALVTWMLEASEGPADVLLAGERFIDGRGPGARGTSARQTRGIISDLDHLGRWHWRSAAEVKPWATDRRLTATGLLKECHGMPHAADACRHALFSLVRDGGYPDPLSRRDPPARACANCGEPAGRELCDRCRGLMQSPAMQQLLADLERRRALPQVSHEVSFPRVACYH